MHLLKKTSSNGLVTLLCLIVAGLYPFLTTGCSTGPNAIIDLPPDSQGRPLKKYVMKQKIWTLEDRFVINDETRNPVFYVEGKLFSVGDKLSFREINGNELAYISQIVFSFPTRYKIYKDQMLFAEMVKRIVLFKDKFLIDIRGPDDYKVTGNFGNYEYTFTRRGKKVASVSKKFFSWSDTYGIAITPGEDDILILAATVVIDMVSHDDESDHSTMVY